MICLSHITSQWTSQSNSYLPAQAPLHHVSSKNFDMQMSEADRGVSEGNEKVLNEGKNFLPKRKKKRETCSDWNQDSSMHHGYYVPIEIWMLT